MNRVLTFVLVVLALGAARTAAAADAACITDDAKKAINSCPNSGPQSFNVAGHGKAPVVSFHAPPPVKQNALTTVKPQNPSEQMAAGQRDDRKSRLQQRALALLITEIQQLEQLNKATEATSKDRVGILRRLAEDYVELENAAFRERTQGEIDRDEAKKKGNSRLAGEKQAVVNSRTKTLDGARKQAIKYYEMIAEEYGGNPSKRFTNPPPAYPLLDEILYYLAYEYEQANDLTNARRVYYDLVTKTPTSKYVPNAYLAFGELFFNEAQGDPSKWDAARQAYEKVITKPPPDNKVYGYAWYKIAYVHWNTGNFTKALDAFKKTIDFGTQWTQINGAGKLADAARRDIIPVYAQSGSAQDAYNFFKPLSGDQGGSNDKTFKMMDDLGLNYIDTGHYPDAITLYKDLLVRDGNSDRVCLYQAHITESVMAMKGGVKDAIVKELDNQMKRYLQYKQENHQADAKQECANKTAALLAETAMAWHLEAVGSQGQRGTGDARTMDAASSLYKRVVDNFTQDEFKNFTFKLVKEDWPTIYKIKYNMADLIYFRADNTPNPEAALPAWKACGPAFDAVVEENPQSADAAEAAYAAVLCYTKVYSLSHKPGSDRKGSGNLPGVGKDIKQDDDAKYKPLDMTPEQKGMVASFNRYVCYIKPDAKDTDGQKQLVEVKYFRARTYFELRHWEEAAIGFKDVADNHGDSDLAAPAAMLYLESINVLNFHGAPNRPSCIDEMITSVPKFIENFCANGKDTKNPDACTTLAKVQCDIQRLKAQRMVDDANKEPPPANQLQLYQEAGKAYFKLWEDYGAKPLRENKQPQCEKLDEIVNNAAAAFQAGRLIASAIRARMVLLNPTYRMENSELAKDAMYKIGGNWQAIAVYDYAADWFEKYANKYKDRQNADRALADATVLRLGLGQEDEAIKDAKTFQANYGAKNPNQTAQVAFAVGAHYADKANGEPDENRARNTWDDCRKALQGSMGVIDKAAPDIQLQGHATLGRCLARLKAAGAEPEYKKVLGIWGDGNAAAAKIQSGYPNEDDNAKARRLGKALDAVGEALFFLAEKKKSETVDRIPYPIYTGIGTRDDVLQHIEKKVVPWFKKKNEAIEGAEKEYARVLTDLKPAPPRWVIAAASRAGLMWGDFVTEFRKAPIPKEWNKFSEVRAVYFQKLDEASEPYKVRAKAALKKCLDQSVSYQYFDEKSRACEKWLSENYKTEYHIVDELRGAPTLSNSGLDDRSPPLIIGGLLWHPAATGQATEKVQTTDSSKPQDKKKNK
jgi:TolA-binding protein